MGNIYKVGKDGVKITFPTRGYTYKQGKDGRVVPFPSKG